MHGNTASAVAAATPSIVPAVVTIAGLEVPVMSCVVSLLGLLLARSIAPASRRKLTKFQERCLTALLALLLLMIVTGQIGGKQLPSGLGMVWGIGLGLSGLLAVEFFGDYVMGLMYALFNRKPPESK